MFYLYIRVGINGTSTGQFLNCQALPKIWTISLVNKQLQCFLNRLSPFSKPYQSGFRAKHSIISATSWVINDIISTALIKKKKINTLLQLLLICPRILKQRIVSRCNQNGILMWLENHHSDRKRCLINRDVKYSKGSSRFCLGPLIVYVY